MDESGTFSISDAPADGEATVVSVTGEVDMETSPSFQRGLLRAIGAGRGGLIVDLSQASFIDSTALTSLVRAFDELRKAGGGKLAIVARDSRMRSLFEVARLDRDFDVYSSRDEALEAVEVRDRSDPSTASDAK
ncbi:MAG: STAS domain-containing protein [Thermoleophilaceae bacterium]